MGARKTVKGRERVSLKSLARRRRGGSMTGCLVFLLFFLFSMPAYADDIEIYTSSGDGVEPNVLIIFDNSLSMDEDVQTTLYDPSTTYPNHLGVAPDAVYWMGWGGVWRLFADHAAGIACQEARNALLNQGFYNGWIQWNGTCGGWLYQYLRTGNYRNYLVETEDEETTTKLEVAKDVIQAFVTSTYGIRMGAMIFNNNNEGGQVLQEIQDMTDANRQALNNSIEAIEAETWTPLAETLYEAGLYFQGVPSYFNEGVTYKDRSPITHWCQKNYVILITDGDSTGDRNAILTTLGDSGDVDGDHNEPGGDPVWQGSDYLDDVAQYLYNADLSTLQGTQNLITYTIGFEIDTQLLEDTAENGRGEYYTCSGAQGLSQVFQQVVQQILETSTSFTAPVVPISQMEKTTSGSKIYLALFKPTDDAFWKGNIKKFAIATEDTGSVEVGDVLDANGNLATDDDGHILDEAVSFWGTADPDGGDTEEGGVGRVLLDRTTPRHICTYVGLSTDLTDTTNLISLDNPLITHGMLDVGTDTLRAKVINYIHGYDVLDEDADLDTSEKRRWILGAFLHSRPAVVHYDADTSVIFAGANDGMLHAFSDDNGSELWAFIPPDLLTSLKGLIGSTLTYFVDGAPKATVIDQDMDGVVEPADGDQVILVFGERRGGSYYYALDVTDPTTPLFLWEIHPELSGDFAELGQTWSSPVIGKVKIGTEDQWAIFLGGGYDPNQDDDPVVGSDATGRGIYVVDVLTGDLLWRHTRAEDSEMIYSIPSDVTALDVNEDAEGFIDRLYVGDTGGRMWRCDIGDPNPTNWSAQMIFDDSGSGRKIFYPPDVVFEHDCEMLFWGTGDRANPKNETIINRIYALKDSGVSAPLTPADLYDATQNLVQDGTEAEQEAALISLASLDGWYVELDEHAGEKVLAPSIVYAGAVYLTTFTPTAGSDIDPCYVGEGMARLYALDYLTAAAVLNFDTSTEGLHKSDRYQLIGTAIPSGVVIGLVRGRAASFIGVGGGIFTGGMVNPMALTRLYWRAVS